MMYIYQQIIMVTWGVELRQFWNIILLRGWGGEGRGARMERKFVPFWTSKKFLRYQWILFDNFELQIKYKTRVISKTNYEKWEWFFKKEATLKQDNGDIDVC